MGDAPYHIIVIAVALVALMRGFRAGLTRQVSGILGVAFGIVAARVMGPDIDVWLRSWMPRLFHPVGRQFFFSTLGAAIPFCGCVMVFSLLTGILNAAMSLFHFGVLNSLAGAVFSLLKWLMMISLLFDLAATRSVDSPLVNCCRHDDGNLVEEVMQLAPAVLGSMPASEFTHQVQLWEAKRIS